jgi:hypothetical protein
MKSNVCVFNKNVSELQNVLLETSKIAEYNELGAKESLRLRLLAEEMVCLLTELVEKFSGEFFIENEGSKYELHSVIKVPAMTSEIRSELIEISSKKKNSASKGILGKIRNAFDVVLLSVYENDAAYPIPVDNDYSYHYYQEWSLRNYVEEYEEKKEIDDELQKSIIGSLADNVVVSIKGGNVHIVISKEFK